MAASERRQVVHQSGHVVAGFEQHQATMSVEFSRDVGDGVGEVVVRQLLRVGQDGGFVAVAVQVVEESAQLSTTPLPTTSTRTLASIGGGLKLCWRTTIGAASPAGSIVKSTS